MGLINGNMMLGSTILRRSSKRVSITYELKDCVSSNMTNTIAINSSYQTTIKSYNPLAYCGVQVLMGNKDISADVYDIETGLISISNIKKPIVIKAETLTTFAEANWYAVKCVAQNKFMSELEWQVGDTKKILIGEDVYTARIVDMTENRYEYSDLSRYSNMVIELVELFGNSYFNTSNYVGEAWKSSAMRKYYSEQLINIIPTDLADVLSSVKIPGQVWNNSVQYFTDDKLFPASTTEKGATYVYVCGSPYEYYANYTNSARQKKSFNSTGFEIYWNRDSLGSNDRWCLTYADGNYGNTVCTNSYNLHVVWAW